MLMGEATLLTSDPLSVQRYALDITRRHGLHVVLSQPEAMIIEYTDVIQRDHTIVGSLNGTTDDLRECAGAIGEARNKVLGTEPEHEG